MIVHALHNYYKILKNDPNSDIATTGYSSVKVSAALVISNDGKLKEIYPQLEKDKKGKLTIPKLLAVPEQKSRTSGLFPYFLCDNMKYTLGIDKDQKACAKQFEAFREFHNKMLENAQGEAAKIFLAFINQWDVDAALQNEIILENFELLKMDRSLVFKIENETNWLHQDEGCQSIWESYHVVSEEQAMGQCMVTGEIAAIARKHNPIKNVRDAQSSGAALVSFNAPSYESYGKKRSFNAPIGEPVQFAYTTVLNHMLKSNDQKIQIGDATTVFWAESAENHYKEMVNTFFSPSNEVEEADESEAKQDHRTEKLVADVLRKARDGMIIANISETIDDETKFYILGLSPNAARISVRYFYTGTFGEFVKKISVHYKDMEMIKQFEKEFTNIPVWKILQETVSPKSSDKAARPLLAGSVMRAMLEGGLYPEMLYSAILQRIQRDSEIRVNYVRASILKLCLLRKAKITNNKYLKEVLTVSLNESTKNMGYLLGRILKINVAQVS